MIQADVGDTIKVVFSINCRFPPSVHPNGAFYAMDSDDAPYNDGTGGDVKGRRRGSARLSMASWWEDKADRPAQVAGSLLGERAAQVALAGVVDARAERPL